MSDIEPFMIALDEVRAERDVARAEIERLQGELRVAQFDTSVARSECDMAIASATRRLREAISDALADLTPGFSPYSLLEDALRASEESQR